MFQNFDLLFGRLLLCGGQEGGLIVVEPRVDCGFLGLRGEGGNWFGAADLVSRNAKLARGLALATFRSPRAFGVLRRF